MAIGSNEFESHYSYFTFISRMDQEFCNTEFDTSISEARLFLENAVMKLSLKK